ncbi:MAG: signal peptide peptidase SppA, partial [Alistipes sp.]|nr:signal peptide peptidase SppA [Alistipes sp.]
MKFMKVFWAALLAVVVGSVVTGLFWLFTFIGIAGSMGSSKSVAVMPNSILKIDLADNIVDSPTINPFAGMNFTNMSTTRTLPLLKVLRAIETAATDDNIKGIYINVDLSAVGSVSSAALEEIRQALEQFKSSGKFIVAYNDIYPQTIYYLASVADKIYLQPEG